MVPQENDIRVCVFSLLEGDAIQQPPHSPTNQPTKQEKKRESRKEKRESRLRLSINVCNKSDDIRF